MADEKFKNRNKEIGLLEELYNKKESKLIIIYGRRRVGKTELLKQFLKRQKGLYLLARQESEKEQLRKMSENIAEYFDDNVLAKNPFVRWDGVFTYLSEKPRMPIIIDEFPYLVQSSKGILGVFQDYWDNNLSKKGAFIVLCGSSIQMMEKLLGKKSPIYGRRTEQILLTPLKFKDACLFFPDSMKTKEEVYYYSILGGMPAYLLEFDYKKSLLENLLENLLKKNKFLYQEVLFSLREELKEPRNYFTILYSIAKGNTKLGNIMNDTGFEKSFVNKYLSVLVDLHLIERKIPITEKRKSRKGIYVIKDNFFKFWFRFIFENQEYIEQDKQELLVKERIMPELNTYVGRIFENIVLQKLNSSERYKDYLIGQWWDNKDDIDILGLDKINKKIIIGEIKFKELTNSQISDISKELERKAEKVGLNGFSKEYLIFCLRHEHFKKENLSIIDFKDI